MAELPKGFSCETCGKWSDFPACVYAHWRSIYSVECECGSRHEIIMGTATQKRKGKKRRAAEVRG